MGSTYYSCALTLLVAILSVGTGYGQTRSEATISNIQVDVDAQRVKITYDVAGIKAQDSVYIQAQGRTKGLLRVRTVSGDIGKRITPGTNKAVLWDYVRDGEPLNEEFKVTVNVKPFIPPTPGTLGGGPANALVSALLPGVGNIMVQPGKKIGLRPAITVAYGGLLIYGILQKSHSNQQYDKYMASQNEAAAQPFYDEANSAHQRYFLATRAAALIWAADVVYTFIRGTQNEKQRRADTVKLGLNLNRSIPVLSAQIKF
ncbi:hypothetical protein GCM10023189_10540 [Nibrella saemangeumensis]|uniref:DUF5683 domain-containing protein n=1 Tax=Nibrella saemangeumensis TaxID=1084526 RepID=A0ABP8MK96_9BACT